MNLLVVENNFLLKENFFFQSDLKNNFNLVYLSSIKTVKKILSKKNFDLIISLGVLHHTNNCKEAIKYICKFGAPNSYIFLGLYHKYGREPFLKHFKNISNKSDEYKFQEYKKLHYLKDEKKLYSWFRDQVLHPHETQHTFEEIKNIFDSINYTMSLTSINKFKKINKFSDIINDEKELKNYSEMKIKKKEYYPGFFITIAKKT